MSRLPEYGSYYVIYYVIYLQVNEGPAEAAAQAGKIVFEDSSTAELEKRKARAARFGVPLNTSEDKKKDLRAQR